MSAWKFGRRLILLLAAVAALSVLAVAAILVILLRPMSPTGGNHPPTANQAGLNPAAVELVWLIPAGNLPVEEVQRTAAGIVDEYNRTHEERLVVRVLLPSESPALDLDAVDFFGPVELSAASGWEDVWADVEPGLGDAYAQDGAPPVPIREHYRRGGVLLGLPFCVDPTFLVYDKTVFDAAGLSYPPQTSSGRYLLRGPDGVETPLPWDTETLARLAAALTLDAGGRIPGQPGFDPAHVVRFGLLPQAQDWREWMGLFGSGSLLAPDGTSARIPPHWVEASAWYYRGLWVSSFIPNARNAGGLLADPAAFGSGRVAMAVAHVRDLSRIPAGVQWEAAPLPSFDGKMTSPVWEKALYLAAGSRHPQESLDAMLFIAREHADGYAGIAQCLPAWGPPGDARARLDAQYPGRHGWSAIEEMLRAADTPSSLAALPGERTVREKLGALLTRMLESPDLDLEMELGRLERELTAVIADASR